MNRYAVHHRENRYIKQGVNRLTFGASVAIAAIVTAASVWLGSGCATLAQVEHQILVDGHAVGRLIVQDGQQVIQLTIDAFTAYRTNDAFRASVDNDIANAAIIAAKVP